MSRTSILGSVAIKLGMQSQGFDKQIKTAQLSLKRFGKSAERIGKNLSLTVTGPLAGLAAQSIRLFDKQAKAIAQVEAGLKSTGNAAGFTSKQLQDMASSLQGRTIFGDEDILKDVTAQLLTFTNISGDAFDRTQQAALDLATRLDGDLKSASIQLGKALNDPVANLSALSRSGIQFTAQQKALIKELVETNRLADAQSIILDELNKQYGGSAEAARKAGTGGLQALQNSFGDILERVGKALLPLLNKLVAFFDGMLAKVNNLTDSQIQFAAGIGMVAAAIGPALLVVSALTKAFIAMGAPLALKIAGILALASGINYVYQNAGAFADRFVYAFNIAKEAVLEMTATAIDALGSLTSVFDFAGGTALKTMAMGIRAGLGNVKKDFTEFKGFGESLMDTFSMLGDKMSGVFSKLFAPGETGGGSAPSSPSGPRFGTRIGTASGGLSNDQSGLLQATLNYPTCRSHRRRRLGRPLMVSRTASPAPLWMG